MKNKFEKLVPDEKEVQKVEKNVKEVKLKSEMYNHDNEKIEKREDDSRDAVMWGFVLGFILFFILLILIIVFTN